MRHGGIGFCVGVGLAASAHAVVVPLYLYAPLEDYPPDVLAQKLEGNVAVHLDISPDGALRCSAEAGGKLAALKRPSCMLIAKRDIFAPFTDASGAPKQTSLDLVVKWKIAPTDMQYGGAIAISPDRWLTNGDIFTVSGGSGPWGSPKLAFTITPMGTIADCKVVKSAGKAIDDAACPLLRRHAMFLPALGPDGKPIAAQGWTIEAWYPSDRAQ